jgi:hypothetical protein
VAWEPGNYQGTHSVWPAGALVVFVQVEVAKFGNITRGRYVRPAGAAGKDELIPPRGVCWGLYMARLSYVNSQDLLQA